MVFPCNLERQHVVTFQGIPTGQTISAEQRGEKALVCSALADEIVTGERFGGSICRLNQFGPGAHVPYRKKPNEDLTLRVRLEPRSKQSRLPKALSADIRSGWCRENASEDYILSLVHGNRPSLHHLSLFPQGM